MHWQSLEEAMESGHGLERAFLCHVHPDNSPSASVNSSTGMWCCYTCGAKGRYKHGEFDISPDSLIAEIEKVETILSAEQSYKSDFWMAKYLAAGPGTYWRSRFTEEACAHFQLGSLGSEAVIPYRDALGRLLGVISRDTSGERKARYLYPKNARVGENLFNLTNCTGDVIFLTEGATDSIAAWEVGLHDTMAIYGSQLRPVQSFRLNQYAPKTIVCAFDQDDAGDTAYRSVCRQMWDYRVERLEWDTYKDLAAMPLEERQEMADWIQSQMMDTWC